MGLEGYSSAMTGAAEARTPAATAADKKSLLEFFIISVSLVKKRSTALVKSSVDGFV
jgi:hypothetical protein